MRFIETKKLSDYMLGAQPSLESGSEEELALALRSLSDVSMQSISIDSDKEFLGHISSVLSVIVSIIYHPHLSNKREEVVIRIEQAQQIDREAFLDTLKDSKLWHEHDLRMIPEEVHYHQHVDELRIYENRFIGFLVDIIDRELSRYSAFYLQRLPTLDSSADSLDPSSIGETVMMIDRLRRKTQFIKGTRFYKEVSRGKRISPKIQPTNILLGDRLYRYCFRFYNSIARYEDMNAAERDLRAYYTLLILGELYRTGFESVSLESGKYRLRNADFSVTLENTDEGALSFEVVCHNMSDAPARHLLGFVADAEREDAVFDNAPSGYESVQLLSLWELFDAEGERTVKLCFGKEDELVHAWVSDRISKTVVDKHIYKRYCPVCRARGVTVEGEIYSCSVCSSSYMFDRTCNDESVWFRRIRRWASR